MNFKNIVWPSKKEVIKNDKKIVLSMFLIALITLGINFATNFVISLF